MILWTSHEMATIKTVTKALFVLISVSQLAMFRCCSGAPSVKPGAPEAVKYAVDFTRENGDHILVPYYKFQGKPMPRMLIQLSGENEIALIRRLREFAPNILNSPPSVMHAWQWIKLGFDLKRTRNELRALRVKYDLDSKVDPRYKQMFRALLVDLRSKSRDRAKALQKKKAPRNYSNLSERTIRLLDILLDAYQASSFAGFINWRAGTINGKPITDDMLEVLTLLRHHGYNALLNFMTKSLISEDDPPLDEEAA